jgi:4-hydroxy-tetrahydrodipicolinate reductase
MGRENVAVFQGANDAAVTGAVERRGSSFVGKDAGLVAGVGEIGVLITDDIDSALENADVLIDFTGPDATADILRKAADRGVGCVVGTTGIDQNQRKRIKDLSQKIPILVSPNMSRGVNTLFYLVKRAVELLGDDYDAEILEIHHNQKKDAPSGTAVQFGRIVAEAKKCAFEKNVVFGRHGAGLRKKGEIGIMALRAADVIGEHTIILAGPGERLELSHKNSSRKTYANGAIQAARFIQQKENGLFSMEDVLGLR